MTCFSYKSIFCIVLLLFSIFEVREDLIDLLLLYLLLPHPLLPHPLLPLLLLLYVRVGHVSINKAVGDVVRPPLLCRHMPYAVMVWTLAQHFYVPTSWCGRGGRSIQNRLFLLYTLETQLGD